jgi:predicted lipoprotein with Yx(FWY)xxD motif
MSISRAKPSLIIGALASLTVLAACGGDDSGTVSTTVAAAEAPASTAPAETIAEPVVKSGGSDLGDVLTSPDGLTLYGFTNDVDAISACYGTCADAWPPVIVPVDFEVGPGLDAGIFATTVREDGTLQLVAGKYPLYEFAGDAAPGDVRGQSSGGVWFAVDVDGLLIEGDAPAGGAATEQAADDPYGSSAAPADATAATIVETAGVSLGDVLVDDEGLTLYGFTNDGDGVPTCNAACADAWPPLTLDSDTLPDGLDPAVFSVVTRDDGTFQLKAGKWPLYRFAGDAAEGDVNGQGSGGVWFATAPDGSLVR